MRGNQYDQRLQVGYGSTWHLLRCLGYRRESLNAIISKEVQLSQIDWLDFPAYAGHDIYPGDHRILDGEWRGVDFLDSSHPARVAYASFWPQSGTPIHWDAVGKGRGCTTEEWLLVEAKAHTGEISPKGTGATNERSVAVIREAFEETRRAIHASGSTEDWLCQYYQYANRFATHYFLRSHGVPSRLIFLYFCGDSYRRGNCPSGPQGWREVLDQVYSSLGLAQRRLSEIGVHEVFVPVDFF